MNTRNYSPEQRALYARTLRAILPTMWDGTKENDKNVFYRYICSALVSAKFHGLIPGDDAQALKEELLARVAPHHSLEDWLYKEHAITCTNDSEAIQAHRLWWIISMIEEFER